MLKNLPGRVAALRRHWPRSVNRAIDAAIRLIPEPIDVRLNPAKYGFRPSEVPPPPVPPRTAVRLYVAPVNFAGQGNAWARAAERLPGVGSVSMQYPLARDYGFAVDNLVPTAVFRNSRRWQRAQFEAVASGFTHVLIEAERPIFGALFDYSPEAEVAALRRRGLQVAMVSHGSDLRLPSRHREIDQWSPFTEKGWDLIPVLEEQSRRHREILHALDAPVFVSTPDLLLDWPGSVWLPLVVDQGDWHGGAPVLTGQTPIVVHAPSNAIIKGSGLIDPVVQPLADEGLLEYRRIEGIPSAEMPALYKSADIVLEQFRIGTYSTAAVEAMAAGRLVIAHVHDQVREHVRDRTGEDVPVVQATPDTLRAVLEDILAKPDHYRAIAARGPGFAHRVHNGDAAAESLRPFLLR